MKLPHQQFPKSARCQRMIGKLRAKLGRDFTVLVMIDWIGIYEAGRI
jgi:hypothetical protein